MLYYIQQEKQSKHIGGKIMKKYDLSKIMSRAWAIKKENTENIFGACLKKAWAEAKSDKKSFIDELLDSGANRWQKYDYDRLYISRECAEVFNIEINYYKTGNIFSCCINGEGISNSKAGYYDHCLKNGFIDLKTMQFYAKGAKSSVIKYFNDIIKEKIA